MPVIDHTQALGQGVLTWTSERDINFYRGDPAFPDRFILTAQQIEWLRAQGIDHPERMVMPKQVHGDRIWRVTSKDAGRAGSFEADAVVTADAGLPIAVRTADCLPLFLHDPVRRVIAAVHAGWKSSKLSIAAKTVEVMRSEYGVNPFDIRAAIGPCIRRESYSVSPEFREHFPEDVQDTGSGLCLDLAGANTRQMCALGVQAHNIYDCQLCTFTDAGRFFSFRREAESAGRLIHVIMMV